MDEYFRQVDEAANRKAYNFVVAFQAENAASMAGQMNSVIDRAAAGGYKLLAITGTSEAYANIVLAFELR